MALFRCAPLVRIVAALLCATRSVFQQQRQQQQQ